MTEDRDGIVLFVLTSHDELGDTGKKTGYYLSELTHPHRVLTNHGYHVEFASPLGGSPPMDPASKDPGDQISELFLGNLDWTTSLGESLRPDDVNPSRYSAVLFVGGHGTMWDLPDNHVLADIASSVYESGGVVAAVCHGPAGLLNVTLPDGSYLIEGKTVVSFTNEEESAVELEKVVPFSLEDQLTERGATFIPAAPFEPQVVTSDRLVTGQNPASAHGVGLAMVTLMENKEPQ